MAKLRLHLALVVAALVLAACGGDDPLIQAMADDMVTQADGLSYDSEEALCVATSSYDSLGSDRLAELGVTVESPDLLDARVTETEAASLVDGLYGCLDVNQMIITQVTATGLPESAAQCIIDDLGDDAVRQLMIDQFEGDELQLGPKAQSAMLACLAAG
jgi:hypothetical protein